MATMTVVNGKPTITLEPDDYSENMNGQRSTIWTFDPEMTDGYQVEICITKPVATDEQSKS